MIKPKKVIFEIKYWSSHATIFKNSLTIHLLPMIIYSIIFDFEPGISSSLIQFISIISIIITTITISIIIRIVFGL